ncbi:putative 2-phosphosulfolactate phosphatase protein [Halorhabdus tiamatea SARL4B]|uniref:2-phosphosulfolactate phosphatase n=1 Tax=Halorhabdus tiamatea SARL4B TaxID=1033806 RepID=F7PJC0_9EURY|nr:2-phosphosulfolactate phosphatase [Halorhabdus tiamatea]ERJ05462.1 putative 2-phosphosulfolactate phosphatase protein [Halorhabdus tiamatea SARL4B]CCQ33576.1 2-phosphosulfolactate phosphatase [Halorhabdus tiamatea SARL4B]
MVHEDTAHSRLDERLIERCEDVPANPEPGAYVVIDTMHFSNTVIELLARGATHVHVPDERGEEFDYRAGHPDALIGGGRTAEYDPEDGYDFFNSPSYVQDIDVEGRPVSMTSTNGGRTVATLRERGGEDVDVFVGAPLNARAIGRFLRRREHPVSLVAAGYQGEIAVEDHVGAALISRYLDEIPPTETEIERCRDQLETAKGPDYVEKHAIRCRDVRAYAMNVNGRAVIPELSGDSLVRARAPDRSASRERGLAD